MSKMGPNSGFRLRNKFLTKSVKKYCQKLFSRTKKGSNSGFWPRKFFWPNYCKKLFSGPKQGPISGFWPRKIFRLNWSKSGQNMV